MTALAAISHGTDNPEGRQAVAALAAEASRLAAFDERVTRLRLGHVDVQQPDIPATLQDLPEGEAAVLVPLLLSAGFHVNVDMEREASAAQRPTVIAPAMGPDERLVDALLRRLDESGVDTEHDVVILGAAGSSNTSAVADVRRTAMMLSERLGAPVTDAYLSFAEPHVHQAIEAARAEYPQRRIVLASYLLAPGYFQTLMQRQGADLVTAALLAVRDGDADIPEGMAQIVLDRFHAVTGHAAVPDGAGPGAADPNGAHSQ